MVGCLAVNSKETELSLQRKEALREMPGSSIRKGHKSADGRSGTRENTWNPLETRAGTFRNFRCHKFLFFSVFPERSTALQEHNKKFVNNQEEIPTHTLFTQ